ncbi:MAG TPA: MerR family transcriptional regulator [Ignavibacteriaceae bacterium]|nr:MerR family transcriptional regulator [Ignavibacteriaceae bacterium]
MSTYNIKMAARLSGVPELSIRSWERRYAALNPVRTDSNRRLYSDSEIEKLVLLRKLIQLGHHIGNLANLSNNELTDLLGKSEINDVSLKGKDNETDLANEYIICINECIDAIRKYDDKMLESILNEASVKFSQPNFIEGIILPLIEKVGDYWREGLMRVSHEHFTSVTIRKLLTNLSDGYLISENAPRILVTTLEGQYHEIGAIIATVLASSDGWQATYLGASLPAEDIAYTIQQLNSQCLFLSIVYPADDPFINVQLRKLREMVGDNVYILVSGRSAIAYKKALADINAHLINTPSHFRDLLQIIRNKINPISGANNE